MKIHLPDGRKAELDKNKDLNEKIAIVKELIDEWINEIYSNWNSNSVRFFLDGLANYLVWHKDEEKKGLEDREVLSIKKVEEMTGKRRGKSTPFTSLTVIDQDKIGVRSDNDEL